MERLVEQRDRDVARRVVDAGGGGLFTLPVPAEVLVYLAQQSHRHVGKVEGAPVEGKLVRGPTRLGPEHDGRQVVEYISVGQLVDPAEVLLAIAREWKEVAVERRVQPLTGGRSVCRPVETILPRRSLRGNAWNLSLLHDLAVAQKAEEKGTAEK